MSIKLSALAIGITLAYGATAAMAADEASIYQQGWFNDASVEQYDNSGAVASISQSGFGNDGVILQQRVTNSLAAITQDGSAGTATINQGGQLGVGQWVRTGGHHGGGWQYVPGQWSNGVNQTAHIEQKSGGYSNDAWITQTGSNVDAIIVQDGVLNTAGIVQHGTGGAHNEGTIDQRGKYNDAYITQNGSNLVANISQRGMGHEATVQQTGSDKLATVSQSNGYRNVAYINQR
ncbi:hypothetical protein CR155_17670 [Pollutimonas nitritireducens]|uniref:Curlin associated repeat-containing protein n=1 Tax=Pollutimonas nitritireducens TaxID=2045209 RepID=A0A2N4UC73_9BURK|nr:hypothetical protein [Pollutimonas nitritireducens]PLC52618.1 hypothetical protein CR155_17670 [Pollutimonas nitritireducens]